MKKSTSKKAKPARAAKGGKLGCEVCAGGPECKCVDCGRVFYHVTEGEFEIVRRLRVGELMAAPPGNDGADHECG